MIAEWVKRSKLPDVCMVPKLPKGEHERKDAYDELVQKVGSDEKVAVVRR
jgi:hypothetical protein